MFTRRCVNRHVSAKQRTVLASKHVDSCSRSVGHWYDGACCRAGDATNTKSISVAYSGTVPHHTLLSSFPINMLYSGVAHAIVFVTNI